MSVWISTRIYCVLQRWEEPVDHCERRIRSWEDSLCQIRHAILRHCGRFRQWHERGGESAGVQPHHGGAVYSNLKRVCWSRFKMIIKVTKGSGMISLQRYSTVTQATLWWNLARLLKDDTDYYYKFQPTVYICLVCEWSPPPAWSFSPKKHATHISATFSA